jgi:hypothetical protein
MVIQLQVTADLIQPFIDDDAKVETYFTTRVMCQLCHALLSALLRQMLSCWLHMGVEIPPASCKK